MTAGQWGHWDDLKLGGDLTQEHRYCLFYMNRYSLPIIVLNISFLPCNVECGTLQL